MPGPSCNRRYKLVDDVSRVDLAADTFKPNALNIFRRMEATGALWIDADVNETADCRPAHRAVIFMLRWFIETLCRGRWRFRLALAPMGGQTPKAFSLRATVSMTTDFSVDDQVGAHFASLTRDYIDRVVVADSWADWQRAGTFFEEGFDEVVGSLWLEAGRECKFSVEFGSNNEKHLGFTVFRTGISGHFVNQRLTRRLNLRRRLTLCF